MLALWQVLTIRSKLFLGIGAILALFALTSAVVLSAINSLNADAATAFDQMIPARTLARQAQYDLLHADDTASSYVMDRNAASWSEELHTYQSDLSAVRGALPSLQNTATPHERDYLGSFEQWLETYIAANERVFALKRAGKYDAAIHDSIGIDTSKGQKIFSDFVDSVNERTKAATSSVQAAARVATVASWIGASAAILLGALIALLLSREITNRLRTVTAKIRTASEVVNTSASEIAAGNSDLSRRTEEQAASLEETAASIEQLTATVRQNAANAQAANGLASGASIIAVKGGRVVADVVETMQAINTSANKIVDIISVIDGIAFQTNILALNAAVEAARAGEQGRGFAVVAGEVRTLAQRSAAAAKEIKALIGDSVEKTAAGTRLVNEAGSTMNEVVEAVKRVTDIMSSIALASTEQGDGIGQINQAVSQMDQVTQQNAALVEEIATSASLLHDHATTLVGAVTELALMQRRGGHSPVAIPAVAKRDQPELTERSRPRPPARARATPQLSVTNRTPAAATTAPSRNGSADDDWNSF